MFILIGRVLSAAYMLSFGYSSFPALGFAGTAIISLILPATTVCFFRLDKLRRRKGKAAGPADGVPRMTAIPPRPFAASLAITLLFSVGVTALHFHRYAGLPTPRPAAGFPVVGDVGWEWLGAQEDAVPPGELPNMAHAVAHAAFLESFEYGGEYGIPERGERVLLREFDKDSSPPLIRERLTVIREFDSAWLQDVLQRAALVHEHPLDASGRAFVLDGIFALFCLAAAAAGLSGFFGRGPLISGDFWRSNFKP
jgi:hypothetical protein